MQIAMQNDKQTNKIPRHKNAVRPGRPSAQANSKKGRQGATQRITAAAAQGGRDGNAGGQGNARHGQG